jgi:hypothetical protein
VVRAVVARNEPLAGLLGCCGTPSAALPRTMIRCRVRLALNDTPVALSPGPPSSILLMGVFVGVLMTGVSVAGLVWRLDGFSLSVAAVLALVASLVGQRLLETTRQARLSHVLTLLSLVPILALAAFLPPNNRDEVAYSVALPRDFARAGRFFYNSDYGPYSAFPGNFEALTTADLLVFHGTAAVRLLNLAMAVGMALIAGALFEELSGRKRWWPISALLVMTAPAITTYVTVAKNDVANAFLQCCAVLACLQYLKQPRASFIALAGLFLGVAAGTKYTSLQFAPCLGVCLAALSARLPLARAVWGRHLVLFALVTGLVASPWYLRNLALFGNPIFPFMNHALHAHNGFGPERAAILKEMFDGLADYSLATATFATFVRKFSAGFGFLVAPLALAGLVTAAGGSLSIGIVFLGALLLSFSAMTFLFGFWEPRFVLTLLVLGSAFAGAFLEALHRKLVARGRGLALLAPIVTFAAALLCWVGVLRETLEYVPRLVAWRTLPERAFEAKVVPFWNVAAWIDAHVSPADKVGVGVDAQPFFYIDRPTFNIHPISEKGDLQARVNPDDFLDGFRSLGLTWLAIRRWDAAAHGYPTANHPHLHGFLRRLYAAVDALERRRVLEQVATVDEVTMYRIAYERR